MKLKKETINSIKYFINYEEEKHKYGDWDKFKITWIKIYVDGKFSFKVHWLYKVAGIFEDFIVEGDLNDYPIQSVLDGLDVVDLIFYDIHKKAYDRKIRYTNEDIKRIEETNIYLKNIYNINNEEK